MKPALLLSLALLAGAAQAGMADSLRFCDSQAQLSAADQDKLIRFGAVIKSQLDQSGARLALIARSGLQLDRFGQRYSHAGLSLKASGNTPWSVRQLYYACEERRPRIYDQGMSGFLLGTHDPALGYVSVVLLPPEPAAALERAALDDRQALQLLGVAYSANAYPFSAQYQNCNQWVVELMATAWGNKLDAADEPRARAQQWLREQAYEPSVMDVHWMPLMWAGAVVPWVHRDDHPAEDLAAARFRVSMPASIEAFVHGRWPDAQRLEFCHTARQIVIRRGWAPIAEGCQVGPGDEVLLLD